MEKLNDKFKFKCHCCCLTGVSCYSLQDVSILQLTTIWIQSTLICIGYCFYSVALVPFK